MNLTVTDNNTIGLSVGEENIGLDAGDVINIGSLAPEYEGPYTVEPTEAEQTLATTDFRMTNDVTVEAIPADYVGSGVPHETSSDLTALGDTVSVPAGYYEEAVSKAVAHGSAKAPEGTVTVNPVLEVSSEGVITATVNKALTLTPTVVPGYVSSGTAGTLTAQGSTTYQMYNRTSDDMTVSGATVTAPAGYYDDDATKSVASGTAGTPTATKGTVSNHAISVTPSVTNTTGYITGGTKTGTAVSVSASDVTSGTKSITSNGTGIDVTEYSAVNVAVPGSTPTLQTVTKTYTPTTSQQTETVTAGAGYDGLEEVDITVNAMPSGSASAPTSISASGASQQVSTGTSTLTLFKNVNVTPVVSAGYVSAGTTTESLVSLSTSVDLQPETTFHPSTSDQAIIAGKLLSGAQRFKAVTLSNLTADNIKSGVTVKVGDATDDDCVTSVTGTYEGGGGSSKNVQVLQSTSRANSSSLTKVLGDLTVAKTGTYDIYWSGGRSNTSSSYTWGTRLYVDGSGYGTENTSWSNNVQSNHLSNVSLTKNQKLSVYSRGRSGSYYTFVPMLVIIES